MIYCRKEITNIHLYSYHTSIAGTQSFLYLYLMTIKQFSYGFEFLIIVMCEISAVFSLRRLFSHIIYRYILGTKVVLQLQIPCKKNMKNHNKDCLSLMLEKSSELS